VRAFLAVPVPGAEALLDDLRGRIAGVRWVRPEGLHVTLHFWASLPEDDVRRVADAAREPVLRTPPFDAALGGLGTFPERGDARVLWLGLSHGAAQVVALQRSVESALAAAGFEREPRAFHPHVTLGRPRTRLDGAWRRADVALPPFTVRDVVLYRSHPGAGGSRYEVLERLPLSASR
jgi:2'-5' RNA ligase